MVQIKAETFICKECTGILNATFARQEDLLGFEFHKTVNLREVRR